MLRRIEHRYAESRHRWMIDAFKDGRLSARCYHDRQDCPHWGNIGIQTGQRQTRRTKKRGWIRSMKRRAWLAGWDIETDIMKEEARLIAQPERGDEDA